MGASNRVDTFWYLVWKPRKEHGGILPRDSCAALPALRPFALRTHAPSAAEQPPAEARRLGRQDECGRPSCPGELSHACAAPAQPNEG